MGNSLSQEDLEIRTNYLEIRTNYIDNIKNLKLPILNIGSRIGSTGYLDFIKPDELGQNLIMKGHDSISRPFIVFKAEFEFPNGLKKKTFTTLFQRHSDNKLSWHCCGHYGTNLMETSGGINNEQIKMLYELFSSGEYKINKDIIDELRLNFTTGNLNWDEMSDDDFPIFVRLADTI